MEKGEHRPMRAGYAWLTSLLISGRAATPIREAAAEATHAAAEAARRGEKHPPIRPSAEPFA
jgi:hypothetical protein